MHKWMAIGAGVALAAALGAPNGWSQNDRNAVNGAQQPAPRNIEMVPARAELQKSLNAKKAKPGDTVTAKLEQTVKPPNEPALKRNTVLVGHVVAVEPSRRHSNSKIVVTFNEARLKDGQELPVKVTVMAVAAPAMAAAQTASGSSMVEGGMPPEAAPAPGVGVPGSAPGMPTGQPRPMNMTQPGTVTTTAKSQPGGIPGVTLESGIHQPASATFLAKGRNVEVPGGTQMKLAIAIIPKGARVH